MVVFCSSSRVKTLKYLQLFSNNYSTSNKEVILNVFDRITKQKQKNRTALLEDYKKFDFLRDEFGWRVADRICDVKKKFENALDVGCGRGHIAKHVYQDMIGTLHQCDSAEKVLEQSEVSQEVPTFKKHCDEELLPYETNSMDLVVSSLSLHWVNNLPATFTKIFDILKRDGCFIGAIVGGETLYELRVSLQLAEEKLLNGFHPHISPFITVQDLGGLLSRSGFTMLTIDVDEIKVNYPSLKALMNDLKGMGESNCAWSRKTYLRRDVLSEASHIYSDMYKVEDSSDIPATFHVINFIGWKPDPSHKQPAERGSGKISMKDIGKME